MDPAQRFTLLRAIGYLEKDVKVRCPDNLAHCFLDKEWREALQLRDLLLKRFEADAPGAYFYGLARTHFFDVNLHEALNNGIDKIIILGSGFDSRAYRFKSEQPITFLEIDRACVHYEKSTRSTHSDVPKTSNYIARIPIDFTKADAKMILDTIDINYDHPIAILAEGLLYYMPEDFFKSILSVISKRASPGSTFIFDYAHENLLQAYEKYYGGEKVNEFTKKSAEPFLFVTTPKAILNQCRDAGLRIRHDFDEEAFTNEYLVKSDGSLAGFPMGGFHLCCAVKED